MVNDNLTKRPSIFFSHSSKDKDALVKLKEMFCKKTGNTIDVFLCSDGQSIPLGRNWVHKVQEAMESAKIMVIFVTPNSIISNWLYFETGFAYSKGIRVVPVGFLGVDLGKMSPPLSLLQGFNISNKDGLDNLIALSNSEFGHKHDNKFSADEYNELLTGVAGVETTVLDQYLPLVDRIHIFHTKPYGRFDDQESMFDEIEKVLREEKRHFRRTNMALESYGIKVGLRSEWHHDNLRLNIDIDLTSLKEVLPLAVRIYEVIAEGDEPGIAIRFSLKESVQVVESHMLSARLRTDGVTLDTEYGYHFKDMRFEIHERWPEISSAELGILLPRKGDSYDTIVELFRLLFARGALYIAG